ncbi:hypothetical protein VTN49DRAFT_6135 [Thermomyces lanuginosus]|uniref:uncharacterized protein n=1 Tax=Thermomyces lanuginosus TaxID=5541 RepID=UPI003742FF71
MLRQVLQGAQRHQHAACARYLRYRLFLQRPFSAAPLRCVRYGGPGDKIRFFEQSSPRSKDRVEVDPEAEDDAERQELKDRLDQLDKELEILREGPFGPNSQFIKELPEKERALALEALRKDEAEHPEERDSEKAALEEIFDKELDDMIQEEFESMAKEEEEDWDPRKPVPADKPSEEMTQLHPYENRFNECLLRVVNQGDPSASKDLWSWYRRCKHAIPSFLKSLPPEVFRTVWESQFRSDISPASRLSHLQTLQDDLRSVGRVLSPAENLMYIEALHDGGETSKALDLWEAQQALVKEDGTCVDAYWKLGVKLFAAHGDPQRAQDIAFAFLHSDKYRDPRILIPVIVAWAKQPEKAAASKAWTAYLQLKTLLGADMTMEDYDTISIAFLNAGQPNLAVAVFKDMMVTRSDPDSDSTALFKRYLGVVGNLQASSITARDVNRISLSVLTVLPRRLENKFFYASWLKKLIGMGDVDSAALVVELMYERGIRPDAKHLNGLIAGWLRQGTASARNKAEQLAWSMIQHRIDLVWDSQSTKPSVSQESLKDQRGPVFLQRTLPQATIETFSILLLHYTRRGDDDMVKYLTKCLDDARIRPNAYFMNHLLYAELRKHSIRTLWEKYQLMSQRIQPDLETFACLWDCGKLQYDRSRAPFDPLFPSARKLFAEMMDWYSQLAPRGQRIAQEEFSKDLHEQITRCFCLSMDLPGTLVALYTMRDLFHFYPDDDTARLLVLQIARMAPAPPGTPRRALRRLSTTPRSKERVEQVSKLLEVLNEKKADALREKGLNVEDLDEVEQKQYRLEILAELVVNVLERTSGPEQVQDQISAAAREMNAVDVDISMYLSS